jgi:hypothetical protein
MVRTAGSATRPGSRSGFTRTDGGVFGFGWLSSGDLLVQTTEDDPAGSDDDAPMSLTEFQDSIRRVLGAVNLAWKLAAVISGWAPSGLLETYHSERHFAGARALLQTQAQEALRRGQDPAGEALRELFLELLAAEQPLRRLGALIAGTSIRYPTPGQHALTGTFAPDLTLHTDQGATSVADLMHTARPVLLDLADRQDLRETARDWQHRVDIHTAQTGQPPADVLLIRPDAHIAWAAAADEPAGTATSALREALSRWFGTP